MNIKLLMHLYRILLLEAFIMNLKVYPLISHRVYCFSLPYISVDTSEVVIIKGPKQ